MGSTIKLQTVRLLSFNSAATSVMVRISFTLVTSGKVGSMEPHSAKFQDDDGRDLEATIKGEGFVWQLWVDLQTKDAVVRKRFPDNVSRFVCKLIVPAKFVDYEVELQKFVDKQTKN